MKIVIAKTAGFCMGVRRAVEMALDAPGKYENPIFTFGPLIHNPQVLALFEEKGVKVLHEIPQRGTGTVLVRAHGVPPETRQKLKDAGYRVIDATCPRVVKVQSIIKSHARKGFATIIIGDRDHPEVTGLMGYAGPGAYVVASLSEFQALPGFEKAIIVAQTTQNMALYERIRQAAAETFPHYKAFDTICDSTTRRQTEVKRMAGEVDAVIVVGGKNSGNTRRLAEIVMDAGKPAIHVETETEMDPDMLGDARTVGITAGASTPGWIINRVLRSLEQVPIKRNQGLRYLLMLSLRFLLLTNIIVGVGAGALCYAIVRLQGAALVKPALSVAFLYVLSMHILNHLTGRAEDKYNDPERENFYTLFKKTLTVMAVCAGFMGLLAAWRMGLTAFWMLLAMSLLGLSYNIRLVPEGFLPGLKYRRIRDLPGSKTVLIALAWGVVTAILPALGAGRYHTPTILAGFIFSAVVVFARTAFFDILDMQGDRIVGKETLPILLGQERSFRLIKLLLVAMALMPPLSAIAGLFTPLAYVLAFCPLILLLLVVCYERGVILPGMRLEISAESIFILCGLLTAVYCMARA